MHNSLFTLAALVATAVAAPAASNHVLHEKRDWTPVAWTQKSRASPEALVPVRIGLTQQNLDRGHDLLMEVSHHESPRYGKWYTAEEIHDLFAPHEDTVDTVRSWLESAGIATDRISQSVNKQWLQFDAAINELEDLVKAEYNVYEHASGKLHTSCTEYHLPEHVTPHIDYITPGIKLFQPSSPAERDAIAKRNALGKREYQHKNPPLLKPLPMPIASVKTAQANGDLSNCDSVATPACIKAFYNITVGTTAAAGNQLGIFEDLNDHYSQEDLNDFFTAVYPTIPTGTHPLLKGVDGAIGPLPVQSAGAESDLDFQISYPIIHPQTSILFQTDDQPTEEDYLYEGFLNNFLDAIDGSYCSYSAYGETGNSPIDPPYPDPKKGGYKGDLQCGVYKPTNVISISYGGSEGDAPVSYTKRQCNEFMKLGMQGVSICVSSGDYGVAGFPGDPSNSGCYGPKGHVFNPQTPASCPYATTLGATFLPPGGDASKDQEVAVTRFASGGGFSNIFPRPSYQESAVSNYLTKYPPPYLSYETTNNKALGPGRYNSIGRAMPDFSAVGDNVLIYFEGSPALIGGTSASSPCFAAILVRINEERIAAGKSSIGFVNPILYANPQVFHDITTGSNPGCSSAGFECQPGWDPVTGLGTPNFPEMLKLFMAQP